MPNHIKNRIELIGALSDIDVMIKNFGTVIKSSINMTEVWNGSNETPKVICRQKGDKWGFCWLDLTTGIASNRENLNQIGLPDDYEIAINEGFLCFPDFKKIIPPPDTDAYHDKPTQEIAKRSSTWWYKWNTNNWGTKWSGYAYKQLAINIFEFDTAWNHVPVIIESLSKSNPEVTIKYSWADEDTGHNCGKAVYHNGLVHEDIPQGGSKEAYELAFELRPDRAEDYQLIDGKYQYIESED